MFAPIVTLAATLTVPMQVPRTEEERNTIAVFSKSILGVVHIKARQQESTAFGAHLHSESTGSGFLIDRDGHILTNYHVIESANRIEVYLPEGALAVARLVGTAPTLDVAVLRVELPESSTHEPLRLGDSENVVIGEKVIAVGHPLSLHNTLTVGVVSAVRRSLPGGPTELQEAMLQTDAAINPGNSGGPLLDSAGEVIGITTALASEAQNLGFAVPIHLVKRVLPDLISMGHPYRPSLGIDGIAITPEIADLFGLPVRTGFLVERVVPGSLSERAGIRAGSHMVLLNETVYVSGGDILTSINGVDALSESQIARILLLSRAGESLVVRLLREGLVHEVTLPLEPMHEP